MTQDEIIEMARQALKQEPREDWNSTAWVFADETLEAFAKLVAEKEREAIYQLVIEAPFRQNLETEPNAEDLLFAVKVMAFDITCAIRARK